MTNPSWRPEQRKVVGNLRAMIARYEETRELRLMGGYTAGADPVLDKAIKSTPRIYEAMNQTMDAPRCDDPFIDLAAALRNDGKPSRREEAMASAHETVIRAVGMALASLSAAFAMYMLAYGAGKTRINGMEHLAIFAQPRGPGGVVRDPAPPSADVAPAVDMAATGSLAASAGQSAPGTRPVEIVAAQADRVWLKIDGAIRTAAPGDTVRGPRPDRGDRRARRRLGPARRQGQRASRVAKGANGASLFTRRRIFE